MHVAMNTVLNVTRPQPPIELKSKPVLQGAFKQPAINVSSRPLSSRPQSSPTSFKPRSIVSNSITVSNDGVNKFGSVDAPPPSVNKWVKPNLAVREPPKPVIVSKAVIADRPSGINFSPKSSPSSEKLSKSKSSEAVNESKIKKVSIYPKFKPNAIESQEVIDKTTELKNLLGIGSSETSVPSPKFKVTLKKKENEDRDISSGNLVDLGNAQNGQRKEESESASVKRKVKVVLKNREPVEAVSEKSTKKTEELRSLLGLDKSVEDGLKGESTPVKRKVKVVLKNREQVEVTSEDSTKKTEELRTLLG